MKSIDKNAIDKLRKSIHRQKIYFKSQKKTKSKIRNLNINESISRPNTQMERKVI